MTMAQTLEVVRCLMDDVKVVMNDGKASMDGIWKALDTMQQIASDVNKMRRSLFIDSVQCGMRGAKLVPGDQLRRDSRSWLSPSDPSPNYNIAHEIHQDGTVMWFFQGSVIHGLQSVVNYREIDKMCKAGLASMVYFFSTSGTLRSNTDVISSLVSFLAQR
ncbi:hypothetical protein EDB89DRAFT_773531 [Lactarius sanguifluus]|nr:hypothetical protein EDB89DRAFT_773531 [Lactarius sanguifluus]